MSAENLVLQYVAEQFHDTRKIVSWGGFTKSANVELIQHKDDLPPLVMCTEYLFWNLLKESKNLGKELTLQKKAFTSKSFLISYTISPRFFYWSMGIALRIFRFPVM